jgi:hypothetical protein
MYLAVFECIEFDFGPGGSVTIKGIPDALSFHQFFAISEIFLVG